jgi:hypothetical protein
LCVSVMVGETAHHVYVYRAQMCDSENTELAQGQQSSVRLVTGLTRESGGTGSVTSNIRNSEVDVPMLLF